MKKRVVILSLLLIIALIGLIISAYYIYFFMNKCSTQECFYSSLTQCKRTLYISENTDSDMEYKILGKEGNSCNVYVQLLQLKKGAVELTILENKDMICSLPFGVLQEPEKNLKNCHGRLKEEIQNIIIQRMHSQIVENLGKISEETTQVI